MTRQDKLAAALAELQGFLGDRATDAALHRMAYSRDWSPRYRDMTDLPDIVIVPHNTDEVRQAVGIALKYELPVVPFAGGTGMGGRSGRLEGRHPDRDQGHEQGVRDRPGEHVGHVCRPA
jgi:D-lactate dehydrogenase (cytochrome)